MSVPDSQPRALGERRAGVRPWLVFALVGSLVLAALVVGVRGLSSIGESDGEVVTAPEEPAAPATTGSEESATEAAATEPSTEPTADPTTEATTEAPERTAFSSPTGNIRCAIGEDSARCDVVDRSWEAPAAPESCDQQWGHGIVVDDGGARFVCSDAVLPGGEPLDYGESIERGDQRCESSRDGMTCSSVASGQGFDISRTGYRLP